MDIKKYQEIVILAESSREKLEQLDIPYSRSDLNPVMSEATLDYHYGKLARAYVDRYNKKEGDDDFNYGGAVLHNIFFPQLKSPAVGNKPAGACLDLINKRWKTFDAFKEEVSKIAMGIQGSGWVYMDTAGEIKTIKNHEYRKGMKIALLIDWWEHSWFTDYGPDKAKYLKNIWRIINWDVVNIRLGS